MFCNRFLQIVMAGVVLVLTACGDPDARSDALNQDRQEDSHNTAPGTDSIRQATYRQEKADCIRERSDSLTGYSAPSVQYVPDETSADPLPFDVLVYINPRDQSDSMIIQRYGEHVEVRTQHGSFGSDSLLAYLESTFPFRRSAYLFPNDGGSDWLFSGQYIGRVGAAVDFIGYQWINPANGLEHRFLSLDESGIVIGDYDSDGHPDCASVLYHPSQDPVLFDDLDMGIAIEEYVDGEWVVDTTGFVDCRALR